MYGHPNKGKQQGTTMKTSVSIAAVLALLAAPMLANAAAAPTAAKAPAAKAVYCQDKVTHKRISCKAAPMAAKPAAAMTAAKPAGAMMAAKPATAAKPAKVATAKTVGKKCGNSHIAADKTCHK